jgi:hypothetical protein
MARMEDSLNTLDKYISLGINSTRCGIAGSNWLIDDDDRPEELHG